MTSKHLEYVSAVFGGFVIFVLLLLLWIHLRSYCSCHCNGTLLHYPNIRTYGSINSSECIVSLDSFPNPSQSACCVCFSAPFYPQDFIFLRNSRRIKFKEPGVMKHTILNQIQTIFLKFPSSCSNEECPICLEPFENETDVIALKCSHGYHERCITGWLVLNVNMIDRYCPFCKSKISVTSSAPLAV